MKCMYCGAEPVLWDFTGVLDVEDPIMYVCVSDVCWPPELRIEPEVAA